MKKIFTLALSAMMLGAGSVFAQEEDMTSYIVNPGFDEDLTFQVNGTMKEAKTTDTSLSDRSWAYIAEDSTVYARPKETSGQSRPDGRKLEAVNGFKGRIKGWVMESNSDFPKCEWTYFGSVPYDLVPQSVPIADDGQTYLVVPERPTEFDGGEGFVYLRAGWTNSAVYKQVVKLPCAQYRLEYWTININPNTSSVAQDLTQITCRKDVFKDEESTGLQSQVWTKHEFEFTPTAEFTMQFGYEAANAGSGGQPIVALDGIKLYKIGEADAEELLQADINDLADEILEKVQTEPFDKYEGLISDAVDMTAEYQGASGQDALEQALKDIQAYKAKILALEATITEYESLVEAATALVEAESHYPGFADFMKVYDSNTAGILEASADEFSKYVEELSKAIDDYRMSQKATPENPADYTFLIASPYFTKVAANPAITFGEGGAIESVSYPNEANYTAGSAPEDGNSEGWKVAGTTGGDQRLNYVQGRVCWNAWRQSADDVAVATTITEIPNGYYTVSAEMITQADYLSNQHLYATSTLQNVVSPSLSAGNWNDDNTGAWEYLTTEKVLVNDGTLTIGALGSAITNEDGTKTTNQTGWFCVTNFRLLYLGEATPEEIAAAERTKFAAARETANAMHFPVDKANVLDSIAVAEDAKDFALLNRALDTAKASEAKYEGVISGTWKELQNNIAGEEYSADAKALAQVPVDYMTAYLASATATYNDIDAITTVLRYYRDTLIPALQKAEATRDEIAAENGKAVISSTIDYVKKDLAAYTSDNEVLSAQVAALNKAIDVANAANIPLEDGSEVTAFLTNATIEASSKTAVPNGWTGTIADSGNNQYTNNGQAVDGSNGYYLDAWNGTAGLLKYKVSQVVEVPNGTYTVKVLMRTTGEGFYLFAAADEGAPVLSEVGMKEATPEKYMMGTETTDDDGNVTVTYNDAADLYGPVWQPIADKLMAKYGIDAATTSASIYDLVVEANGGSEECPEDFDADEWKIFAANKGTGRGWIENSLTIEVKNHKLEVGVATGDAFEDGKTFTGTWLSADNFSLTLNQAGDNTGWDVTTGVQEIAPATVKTDAIYNLAGQKVDANYKGIVIKNGKKMFVK